MTTIKFTIPVAILLGGFLICASWVYGTPEYAKKESKSCTYCHGAVAGKDEMLKNLNSTGSCYKDNGHSLAKCAAPKQ